MSLTITERAAEHVKNYGGTIRLSVIPNGCTGLAYKVTTMPEINDDDHVYETNGVTLVASQHDIPYINGTEIDYIAGLNSKFIFNNPIAKNQCGCGESFNT